MKKLAAVWLVSVLFITLTACQKPHAHQWQDATCSAPKTCVECGATEGEPLEHTLKEANYQSGPVCVVCGQTVGDPLPAALDGTSIPFMEQDTQYDYPTFASENPSVSVLGKVFVENYQVIPSDETHPAKDGYEWRIANIHYVFDSEAARTYGYRIGAAARDYYQGLEDLSNSTDTYTVSFNGADYPIIQDMKIVQNGWTNHVANVVVDAAFQVPTGYDGVILCIYRPYNDGKTVSSQEDMAVQDGMIFRMA